MDYLEQLLRLLSPLSQFKNDLTVAVAVVASQCGNDRPGFGLHSITPGIECYNYKTY
jgi:hypothetical protein